MPGQKSDLIIPQKKSIEALQTKNDLARAGEAANRVAADYLFTDYRQRRAERTIRTQTAALQLWVQYLVTVGAANELLNEAESWALAYFTDKTLESLADHAESQGLAFPIMLAAHYCQHLSAAWHGVTWGLVEGFVKWLLNQGYSVSSINNRLSAVKVYARLAAKAGTVSPEEHALIREVRGYGNTEGKRVNIARATKRVGYKKEEAIVLTAKQARRLKTEHLPTPQGIRDRLLICMLLDLGLRASEVSALKVEDFREDGYVTVYRQKTDSTDRMALSEDITVVLADYSRYMRKNNKLLRGSRKNGKLTDQFMSVRAIGARIKILGRDILSIWELSPHDLRHTWATRAAKESNPFVLRDAGGWTNMQTPSRYVEKARVVNKGIHLDY
jgi:integrase